MFQANSYNFLSGFEDPQLSKSDMERGAFEWAILLLDNDYVDGSCQSCCVYFRVEILHIDCRSELRNKLLENDSP